MFFSVLASGSKANCTFVQSSRAKILIDCGLSAKQTCIRLEKLNIDPTELSAIVITHGHSDHTTGVSVMSRKFNLPVYSTNAASKVLGKCNQIFKFIPGEKVLIKDITIETFLVTHDAPETCGILVRADNCCLGHLTDVGRVTTLILSKLANCDSLVLETNHDRPMLMECFYPWSLKQRIASSHGHLSNSQAAELIEKIAHENMNIVALAHISENSNTPELAHKAIKKSIDRKGLGKIIDIVCCTPKDSTKLLEVASSKRPRCVGGLSFG